MRPIIATVLLALVSSVWASPLEPPAESSLLTWETKMVDEDHKIVNNDFDKSFDESVNPTSLDRQAKVLLFHSLTVLYSRHGKFFDEALVKAAREQASGASNADIISYLAGAHKDFYAQALDYYFKMSQIRADKWADVIHGVVQRSEQRLTDRLEGYLDKLNILAGM